MSTPTKFLFAKEVSRSRHEKKLIQEQVAEQVNISVRWFQRIESGQRLPSAELMLEIIKLLEIDSKNLKE